MHWQIIEPLGLRSTNQVNYMQYWQQKKELMGVLLQSSHHFLAQVAQDM
jgi:hypothetical protein